MVRLAEGIQPQEGKRTCLYKGQGNPGGAGSLQPQCNLPPGRGQGCIWTHPAKYTAARTGRNVTPAWMEKKKPVKAFTRFTQPAFRHAWRREASRE